MTSKKNQKKRRKNADRVQIYERGISAQYSAVINLLLFRILLMMNQSVHQREKKNQHFNPPPTNELIVIEATTLKPSSLGGVRLFCWNKSPKEYNP